MKWISHLISDSRHTGLFFSSLVPPNFSTKKKIRQAANRPFLVTGFTGTAAAAGWHFSFWYWIWGVPVLNLRGTRLPVKNHPVELHCNCQINNQPIKRRRPADVWRWGWWGWWWTSRKLPPTSPHPGKSDSLRPLLQAFLLLFIK